MAFSIRINKRQGSKLHMVKKEEERKNIVILQCILGMYVRVASWHVVACGVFVWCTKQVVCSTACMLLPQSVLSAERREEEEARSEYFMVSIACCILWCLQ